MHELSIAMALKEQVAQRLGGGQKLVAVRVFAGALRGIDPQTMRSAWTSATLGSRLAGARMDLSLGAWRLMCEHCGRDWASDDAYAMCACGNDRPKVEGTDELTLIALEVA